MATTRGAWFGRWEKRTESEKSVENRDLIEIRERLVRLERRVKLGICIFDLVNLGIEIE